MATLTIDLHDAATLTQRYADVTLDVRGANGQYTYTVRRNSNGEVVAQGNVYRSFANAKRYGKQYVARHWSRGALDKGG